MLGSIVATLLIAALAMLPGLLLIRPSFSDGTENGKIDWGRSAAAATISLILMMLATALLGAVASLSGHSLSAMSILPVSFLASGVVWRVLYKESISRLPLSAINWHASIIALALIGFGLLSLSVGIRIAPDGAQQFHAWYNADWFKHIGHVHALANAGVPAKDIFGGNQPLHYYWLIYIVPGAATSVAGDAWAALAVFNSIVNGLFGILLYAVIRHCCSSSLSALAICLIALITITPAGFFVNFASGTTMQEFLASEIAPSGSALLATSGVIPQHTLAMCGFLAWALLSLPNLRPSRPLQLAGLASLTALPAISTLLGTLLLVTYGLLNLYRRKQQAFLEVATMLAATIFVTLALGILDLGNPTSAIDSPLLTNAPAQRPAWLLGILAVAKMMGLTGIPAVVVLLAIARWRPHAREEKAMMQLAISMAAAAVLGVIASQVLMTQRLAEETFIRATIPVSVATAMSGAWLIQKLWADTRKARIYLLVGLLVMLVVGLPAHYTRLVWTSNFGDIHTTSIPLHDRQILAVLRKDSGPQDIVWQFPEKPALGTPKGSDNWSAIIAGRTVLNSERATDYAAAEPSIALSERFFAGEPVELPAQVDWVYLSRALHPATYDSLVLRMRGKADWVQRACYTDACLFSRVPSARP